MTDPTPFFGENDLTDEETDRIMGRRRRIDPVLEALINEESEAVASGRAERRILVDPDFVNPMECPACQVVDLVRREDRIHCGPCGRVLVRECCPTCGGNLEWREPPPEERRELCPNCRG